jgi:hypothetical protein
MKCEQYQDLFTAWADNQLNPSEKEKLEQHIAGCESCAAELQEMQSLWAMMGEVPAPEPSSHMRVKFNAMLDTYKESVADEKGAWDNIKEQFSRLWQLQPKWPFAYNIATVLICFAAGYWFLRKDKSDDQSQRLQALTAQVHELKQTMMLALLDNPSASERIRGVSYTTEIKHADKQVIDALLATLNNDPNVNVRLSTLEALTHLASHPEVRQGLIQSITGQDSPLMQSAIADVMLKLQERRSVGSFKELLKQKHLDQGVRAKIKETINSLI